VKLIWEKYYSNGNLPNHAKKGVLLVEGHPKTPRQIQRHGLDFSSEWGHPAFFGMISGLGLCRSMLFLNSIPSQKNPSMTLQAAKMNHSLTQTFHLPLSTKAYQQFVQLELTVNDFQPSNLNDTWSYIWGRQEFSCKMAYKQLAGSAWVHPAFKWIWKSSCQHKHKVFFWLLAQDRLSTRNILRRKNMHLESYACVLCDCSVEEVDHLFLHCVFAKTCWNWIGIMVPQNKGPFQILESFRAQLNVSFFMEIIIIMCWSIWTVRNNLVFRGEEVTIQKVQACF
jgi:hypothetical protein